ncbi:MAG: hypothetical protein B6I24_02060 [Bacteroidetes bacterium 4572_128]|nr:MAG: hypothetical protein B6I24_02060 [Bacteroidetes bacterium 4572_128]
MEDFKERFIEDASELISDLESDLLIIEKEPKNKELIERIFRVMHNLKGVSAMYGFEKIGELTHHLETIYDFIRDGKLEISDKILNITLNSVDILRNLLEDSELSNIEFKSSYEKFFAEILEFINEIDIENPTLGKNNKKKEENNKNKFSTYYINFFPEKDIFLRGVNIFSIFEEIDEIGEFKVFPHIKKETLSKKNPLNCFLFWEIYLVTNKPKEEIDDIFIFVDLEYEVYKLSNENLFLHENFNEEIKKKLLEEKINIENLKNFIENNKKNFIIEEKEKKKKEKNKINKKNNIFQFSEQKTKNIRVDSDKLDELMNLVSEFVITQAELNLIAKNNNITQLSNVSENIQKLSVRLRNNAFDIRLVPIRHKLVNFQRLVRDLSSELGKDVEFITEGVDTELDKTILDELTNPLMHIIRNSIDHGIEFPEERELKNKNRKGKIFFKAMLSSSNIIIQIEDDGAGIDTKIIQEKAIEKELIRPEAFLSNKEILELIFLPGFSTAEEITDVSGRGVGMDVVKKRISNMRGEIKISSKIDEGTAISISLPLTLSIVDALLVKISNTHFLIPINSINNCDEIKLEKLENSNNKRLVLNDKLIPFIHLRKEFEMKKENEETEKIVVVDYEEIKVALIVDDIIGKHQAVLKPLGDIYDNTTIISRASILGNGDIALVIDTNKLIKELLYKIME